MPCPNFLVRFLSVAAVLDERHDDVLRRHEGQLLGDAPCDHFGVDDETLGYVLQGGEDDVCGQECLGDGDAAVGAA